MKLIWCNGFAEIYAQLEEGETYVVLWFCRGLCSIGGGVNLPWVYVHYALSARSAKFGVAVVKASMLD